jgi:hypothetical protein
MMHHEQMTDVAEVDWFAGTQDSRTADAAMALHGRPEQSQQQQPS